MRTKLPNDRAYDVAGNGDHSLYSTRHCCICGKPMDTRLVDWLLLSRAADGSEEYAISHPEDAAGTEPSPSEGVAVWVAPIGITCLRKHPELQHAVLKRKD